MHVVRRGTGKPLLMVHGLGSSLHNWDRVVPALESERELVLIDLPGFGQTPPLAGEASFSALTDALAQFVASEGLEHVDVVGSSMGARMVVELARRGHVGTTIALDPGGFCPTGRRRCSERASRPRWPWSGEFSRCCQRSLAVRSVAPLCSRSFRPGRGRYPPNSC